MGLYRLTLSTGCCLVLLQTGITGALGPWLLPGYPTGVTMSGQVCSFSASLPRSRDMGFLGVADGGLEIGTPGFAGCRYPVLISQRGQRQIPYSLTPREEQGNGR